MLSKIAEIIAESNNIAIIPHVAADGDALGSAFGLALAVSGMGKSVTVFLEEDIPHIYDFLPGKELSEVFAKPKGNYDVVIAADCGDTGRLGSRKEIFDGTDKTINIDHHGTNTFFAGINYVDTASSATGEVIYKLLELLGITPDKDIATCLYVAISTDTGSFRYSNTTPATHKIAAELIKSGVDVAYVSQKVFDVTTYEKVKLTGEAIHSLELFENGRIAVMMLTQELLQKTGAKDDDCSGIINTARNIEGVEVAVLLRQLDNEEIKVNLRSNSTVDVSAIASSYSGGGHKKAAGYTTGGKLEEAKSKLLELIRNAF